MQITKYIFSKGKNFESYGGILAIFSMILLFEVKCLRPEWHKQHIFIMRLSVV